MISFPAPYIVVSDDETKVLVMQLDRTKERVAHDDTGVRLSNGKVLHPMKDFPHSGVYSLPDKEFVYGITWYSEMDGILTSSDFQHIMRLNKFGVRRDHWALRFYDRGKEVKTYSCDELLTAFGKERYLPFTTSDYHHPWCKKPELIVNRVLIHTSDRQIAGYKIGYSEVYEFDITSGEIRSKEVRNAGFITLVITLLSFLAVACAIGLKYLRSRQKRHPAN